MGKHVAIVINLIKLYFFDREGKRPHIHVDYKATKICEIWLDTLKFKKKYSKDDRELSAALKLVKSRQEELVDFWNETFNPEQGEDDE